MNKIRLLPLVAASLLSLGMAAQTSFPGAESIRYEAPEGTVHAHQVRSATSFYDPGEGVAYLDSVEYYTADYVEAEDGSVYLSNPFVFFPHRHVAQARPCRGRHPRGASAPGDV